MECQHIAVIHAVDMVPRQDEHVRRVDHVEKIQVLVDGIRRALVPVGRIHVVHVRRQYERSAIVRIQVPAASVADVPVQFQRLVLRQDSYRVDAGIAAITERKIDNSVFCTEEHGWLGYVFRQHTQPASLSSGQDHGQTFTLPQGIRLPCFYTFIIT
jgi:hypothetical protein